MLHIISMRIYLLDKIRSVPVIVLVRLRRRLFSGGTSSQQCLYASAYLLSSQSQLSTLLPPSQE